MSSGLAWTRRSPTRSRQQRAAADRLARAGALRLRAAARRYAGRDLQLQRRQHTLLGAAIAKATGSRRRLRARKAFGPLDITTPNGSHAAGHEMPASASGCGCGRATLPSSASSCCPTASGTAGRCCPRAGPPKSIKPRVNGDGIYFYGYQWWLGRPSPAARSPGSRASASAASACSSYRASTSW